MSERHDDIAIIIALLERITTALERLVEQSG